MKSKKIYLVRHGQTDYNLKGIVQGSGIDSSLNERGREQSRQFFDAYKDVPFDKVYTSKLKRTTESVEGFINLGIPHEMLSGLNEINWGTREGQVITPEEDAYYHWVIREWQNGNTTLPIEGGESPQDVYDRQKLAVEHIMSHEDEENILICMHGRAMRVLLCQVLNYPLHCMDEFEHSNLCLYLLNFTGSMFTVERFNDTNHLVPSEIGNKR
ncbi:histidine phosphatase family protein [Fulvivirga sedimenti]|uniref:Histidine phosphatase family protein n=1 Tax=Fulvivirga sedimenti TaxID=2879465 RepID=A0A9X1HLR0_9BACT|nr:histidine phosphatase family protein [Fulvivirga sedimenti]MCA6073300.1 histidine phosphatase family protein [Fulvivirga sedimenti]